MSGIIIEKTAYGGWDNCVRISNGIIDLVITVDVGPRIIRYGFFDKKNEFCEVEKTLGKTGGSDWLIYGGHRLWHSPEDRERTYEPDNSPVRWEEIPSGIRTIQNRETLTGIIKEMEITVSAENSKVNILHRMTNSGLLPLDLSLWSISAMAPGGREVVPVSGADTGLLPNRRMVLWPYTKLDDPRLRFEGDYMIIQHDPAMRAPMKIGTSNESEWAAYFNNNHLFVKYYKHEKDARYPDFGVSYETYVNDFMLEMETLSPSTRLEPGAYAEHREKWQLFDGIQMPVDIDNTEKILKVHIYPEIIR